MGYKRGLFIDPKSGKSILRVFVVKDSYYCTSSKSTKTAYSCSLLFDDGSTRSERGVWPELNALSYGFRKHHLKTYHEQRGLLSHSRTLFVPKEALEGWEENCLIERRSARAAHADRWRHACSARQLRRQA